MTKDATAPPLHPQSAEGTTLPLVAEEAPTVATLLDVTCIGFPEFWIVVELDSEVLACAACIPISED